MPEKRFHRWYASWYDSAGKRRRKSLPTRQAAQKFETKMKEETRKKARPSPRSARSSKPTPRKRPASHADRA